MGCGQSQLHKLSDPISLYIYDKHFMKAEYSPIHAKLQENNIVYQYFISMNSFKDAMAKTYINQVVTNMEEYEKLYQMLQKMTYKPNLYVIGQAPNKQISNPDNVIFVEKYEKMIELLLKKNQQRGQIKVVKGIEKQKKLQKIDVKILQNTGGASSELILETALKNKNINYEIYRNFHELQQSMTLKESEFIVTDYVFHKEVLNLVKDSKTRILCHCSFNKNQTDYNPKIYFLSENLLEIVTEISQQLNFIQYNHIKCSKVYMYTTSMERFSQYKKVLEHAEFQVRTCTDVDQLMKETVYFFAVTVLVDPCELKNLTKELKQRNYLFKIKLVPLPSDMELNLIGFRKIIKQIKRGYRAKKALTNSVDIIDKHHDSPRFQQLKEQLEKNDIIIQSYKNLNEFVKQKVYISPFIICNFQDRVILNKYLRQISATAKIILFCSKNKLAQQSIKLNQYALATSHFGKIIKFIKKTPVYVPLIVVQSQLQLHDKLQKLKNKNKRISALKWYGLTDSGNELTQSKSQKLAKEQQKFEFLNIAANTSTESIRDVQKNASQLWKLDYKPFKQYKNFKQELAQTLKKLKTIYKISIPTEQFQKVINKINSITFLQLLHEIQQFFDSENQLGLKINQSLLTVDKMDKQRIVILREFVFLLNLNFISLYRTPKMGKVRLQHWTNNSMIAKCEVGSYFLTKNYFIFYESSMQESKLSKYQIILDMEYNTIKQNKTFFSSYFKLKNKYIFSPLSQFIIKQITKNQNSIVVELEHVPNVNFLSFYFKENLEHQNQEDYLLPLYNPDSQHSATSIASNSEEYSEVKTKFQRFKGIQLFKQQNYDKAIQVHKAAIQREQYNDSPHTELIDEMKFQLINFYWKNQRYDDVTKLIKQLVNDTTNSYLRKECETIINKITNVDQSSSKHVSQKNIEDLVVLRNTIKEDQEGSEDESQYLRKSNNIFENEMENENDNKQEWNLYKQLQCKQFNTMDFTQPFEDCTSKNQEKRDSRISGKQNDITELS